jgi:hypothetical protein
MWGLGDNIYSRPFICAAAAKYEIWLETPWPELYADLDIKFLPGSRRLRTQQKNIARQAMGVWSPTPQPGVRQIKIGYASLGSLSIIKAMELQWLNLGVAFDPTLFDLPLMWPSPVISKRPIAVVRPVTVRKEWRNEARNPKPEYIVAIAAELMATHTVVAVADIEAGEETILGELPPAHQRFLHGELTIRQLLALISQADIIIGGVGWIVPAGLALKIKTFVVMGGNGGHNAPDKITDPRLDVSRIAFLMPERFCQCTNLLHNCEKTILDPVGRFTHWWRNARMAA